MVYEVEVDGELFHILSEMNIVDAARLYVGQSERSNSDVSQLPDTSVELARQAALRQSSEIDRIVRTLRSRVHTGQLIAVARKNRPDGTPYENETYISLHDLIEIAAEQDDANEPLRSLANDWRLARGISNPNGRQAFDPQPSASLPPLRRKAAGLNYEQVDRPLLEEMRRLIDTQDSKTVWDAALSLADRAKGSGSPESRAKRLAKRFNALSSERD